jgi:prevent-host-death family protein
MVERKPAIQTMSVSETRDHFSQVVDQVKRHEARVLVEKSGIPVAAIVSARDLERLRQLDEQREANFAAMAAIGEAFKDVPEDELEAAVAEAVAAARAELYPEEPKAPPQ